MHVSVEKMSMCECRYPKNPEDGVRSPRAGGTDCCESPDLVTGTRTQALCRNSTLLTDELSPKALFL